MIRVKFLTKAPANYDWQRWLDHFPGRIPKSGECEFIFDPANRDYDWLVVYDDLPSVGGERFTLWSEPLACPRSQTLLITTEPSTIKTYGNAYTRQFGWVLTSQEPWAIRHPGAIYRQAGLIPFYEGQHDEILNHPPENKTAIISTVCSSKQQSHTLHRARYEFTQKLQKSLPTLEVFGHGVCPIDRKNDALDSFRYHVAIENHIAPHHWTEKLSDAYLGLCLPFYYGCLNAADYFPAESFIPIDITRYDESLERIKAAIANDEYTRRLPAIREARRLVLEEYSTFPNVSNLIAARHPAQTFEPENGAKILSRHALRAKGLRQSVGYALEKVSVQIRHALRKNFGPSTK